MRNLRINLFYTLYFLLLNTIISQTKKDVLQLQNLYNQFVFSDFNRAHDYAEKALIKSRKINDSLQLLNSYKNLSEIYYYKTEIDSSKKYNTKAIDIAVVLKNDTILIDLYNRLGSIEKKKNNPKLSLKYFEKALLLSKKHKKFIDKIEINMARLYFSIQEKKNAEGILNKLLNKKNVNKYDLADAFNVLGVVLLQNDKNYSLKLFNKSLSLLKNTNNVYLKSIVSYNLGHTYLYLNNNQKTLSFLQKAETLSRKVGNNSNLHHINISFGIYYERNGNYKEAIKKYKQAIEQYGNYVDDYQKAIAYWTISGVFYHSKRYKEAYSYLEMFTDLNEKVLSIEKKKEFEKIRTIYEVDKKNTQIELLETQKKVELQRQQLILTITITLLISLLLISLFYRYRLKTHKTMSLQEKVIHKKEKEKLSKDKELKRIEGYIEGQEIEKNRIAKELHDGIGGQLMGLKHLVVAADNTKNIYHLQKNIIDITEEIRFLSHNLSSYYSSNKSLENLIDKLKENYKTHLKITSNLYPIAQLLRIAPNLKHSIYRILQELIQNIYKHADATEAIISLTKNKKEIILIIEDNGKGFDISKNYKGIGLNNVNERVLKFNGSFIVDSVIKKGTTIIITLPNKKNYE